MVRAQGALADLAGVATEVDSACADAVDAVAQAATLDNTGTALLRTIGALPAFGTRAQPSLTGAVVGTLVISRATPLGTIETLPFWQTRTGSVDTAAARSPGRTEESVVLGSSGETALQLFFLRQGWKLY